MMLVPSDSEPRAKGRFQFRQTAKHRFRAVAEAGNERWTRFFGEAHRHFVFKLVLCGRRVVADKARGGLRGKPFTNISWRETRAFGELVRRHPTLFSHCFIQAKPVA